MEAELKPSLIHLGIDKMELDWNKYSTIERYDELFVGTELKEIPHYYYDDETETLEYVKSKGYSIKLSDAKQRLDIMGMTLIKIEENFYEVLSEFNNKYGYKINYNKFFEKLKNLDIEKYNTPEIEWEYEECGFNPDEYVRKIINITDEPEFFSQFSPYEIIRILAENPKNLDKEIYWSISNEYENTELEDLPLEKKTIILTEGKSDAKILTKAIKELYPNISNYFMLIEDTKGYSSVGASKLLDFAIGLIKIKYSNKIIVIFDNDFEGNKQYEKSKVIKDTGNIVFLKLPDLEEFNNFKTIYKNDIQYENINGRAVSIECFLDFNVLDDAPIIKWSDKNKEQGQLKQKEKMKKKTKSYSNVKMKKLLDYIIKNII